MQNRRVVHDPGIAVKKDVLGTLFAGMDQNHFEVPRKTLSNFRSIDQPAVASLSAGNPCGAFTVRITQDTLGKLVVEPGPSFR